MPFFSNKRKDFSIQPPKQEVSSIPFFVTDSSNIDFTFLNNNLTADLTLTGVIAGTYGSSTQVPVLQIDQWGRVTGVNLQNISTSGLALETNGVANGNQALLNLVAGTNMTITDDGLGNITFDAAGSGSLLNEPTGILFGGNLSASIGGTTFDLTAGIGQIVTQTSTISGVSTTVTSVSWAAATAVPITNISTAPFTYVLIDNTGTIIQQTTPFTDAQYKTHIVIGIVCHIDLATVNLVTNTQNVAYQDPYRLVEMIRLFGPIKKTGMVISANGTNLRVDRTAGEVFKIGSNYTTAAFEPDVDTISAATPALLCRVHRDGSGGFVFDTNSGAYYNFIEPNFWDNGSGTLQSVPSNRWTIQRLFMFPNNPNDIICYYGIKLYNNFSEARAGVEFGTFDEAQITAENAVFLGYLFVRHNATDLSDPNEAAFLQAGLFRGIPPGGGGSGGGGTVLTDDSIQGDGTLGNEIKLVNDATSPGVNKVYGTDNSGNKGWRNELVTPAGVIPGTVVGTFPLRRNVFGFEVIPSADRIYIPGFTDNIVEIYEASSGNYLGFLSITGVYSVIYVSSINEVWITNALNTTILRYAPVSFTFLGSFVGGGIGGYTYVEISPTKLYIANWTSNTISDLDPSTLTVTATITAAALGVTNIRYIAYVNNPASFHYEYLVGVCPTQNEFYAINTTTNAVAIVGTNFGGTLGSPTTGIAYNSVEDNYYISFYTNNQIRIFKPTSASLIVFQERKMANYCIDILFDSITQKVYASCFAAVASGFANMHNFIQCIDENNLYWTAMTPTLNLENTFTRNRLRIDSVNGYVYTSATLTTTGFISLSKVKI